MQVLYNTRMDHTIDVLPKDFLCRLRQFVPESALADTERGLTHNRPTTFRVNTIKSSSASLVPALTAQGFGVTAVPWFSDAFILTSGIQRDLTQTDEYRLGHFYVQSLSSMIPPLVLDPKPDTKTLDITAAPGSKTTQIAACMKNQGIIIANDTSRTRMYRLEANLNIQGVTIATITRHDARSIWKHYPEQFDYVLADVPCSMEGRFCVSKPETYNDWSLKKVRDMALLQRWILRSAISTAKPGGTIVYSTCTLSPEENEGVVDWILNKDKGAVTVEHIDIPGLPSFPGITSWGDKTYDTTLSRALRIYPSDIMEGFFVIKLRKRKSTVPRVLDSYPGHTIFDKGSKKPEKRYAGSFQRSHKRIA